MNLYFEIGQIMNTTDASMIECVKKEGLSCAHCFFCDKPTVCAALSCSDGVRPDGNNVVFLRLYGSKGGEK